MMKEFFRHRGLALMAVMATLCASGCSDIRETLGLNPHGPDEFSVADGAPLSIPPDFALRPPEPGAPPRAQQVSPSERAAATLFGTEGMRSMPQFGSGAKPDAAEQALLTQAKAVPPDSDIRAQIDRESGDRVSSSPSFIQDILFWQTPQPASDATTVDAQAEKSRIAANQAAGKPLTAGDTPVITRGKSGGLGDWF